MSFPLIWTVPPWIPEEVWVKGIGRVKVEAYQAVEVVGNPAGLEQKREKSLRVTLDKPRVPRRGSQNFSPATVIYTLRGTDSLNPV